MHIMLHQRVPLKFKRNVETFKYLNLWQPFPLRFLAAHSPTCWGLFPALICARNKKKWQLVSSERESLLQRPFNDSSQGSLHLNRGVDNYNTSCIEVMNQPCGQPGAPFCLEKRKVETIFENTELNPKTLTQVHFTVQSFWLCLLTLSETANMVTLNPNRERWGLSERSLRGTKSPTEPSVFL